MDPALIPVVAGVAFGGIAICIAGAVWFRKEKFGFAGAVLVAAGVLLIGLSVWRSVKVDVGTSGFKFEGVMAGVVKPTTDAVLLNNKPISIEGPTQIGFWTPSAATKNYAGTKPWEIMDSDTKLDEFADDLKRRGVLKAYRRYHVVGEGRGPRQAGVWWVSTNTGSDFKLADFVKAYTEFWHPGQDAIYMEIQPISSSGYSIASP